MNNELLIYDTCKEGITYTTYRLDDGKVKPLCMFFHGLAGNRKAQSMGRCEYLANHGFTVISMDLYLHGERAIEPFKSYDYTHKMKEIINIVYHSAIDAKYLIEKYFMHDPTLDTSTIYAFGVSCGGMTMFKLATMVDNLKVFASIVSSPSYVNTYYDNQNKYQFEKDEDYFLNLEFNMNDDPLDHIEVFDSKKIFMACGRVDDVVPMRWCQKLYDKTTNKDIQLKIYETGHCSTEEMNNDVINFLISNMESQKKEKLFDENMKIQEVNSEENWINPIEDKRIKVAGFPWFDKHKVYVRYNLDDEAYINSFNNNLLQLALCTSGGQLAFYTNSSSLKIKVKVKYNFRMSHQAFTAQQGFDLYLGSSWEDLRFAKVTLMDISKKEYTCDFGNLLTNRKLIVLNFPLYGAIDEVLLSLDEDCSIEYPHDYLKNGKVLVYGTSITQGGCASRPGLSYTNILSRELNYEFYNMGFSGNGLGEWQMAKIMGNINDIDLYIIDYEANANTCNRLELTLETFIETLYNIRPNTPILLVSQVQYASYISEEAKLEKKQRTKFQLEFVKKFIEKHQECQLFFIDGGTLLGNDYDNCQVDGVHLNDIGFYRFAHNIIDEVKNILNKRKK